METKRLMIAIALSIVIIIAYQVIFAPKPVTKPVSSAQSVSPQAETPRAQPANDSETGAQNQDISSFFAPQKKDEEIPEQPARKIAEDIKGAGLDENIVIENELFRATFTNRGAGLKSFVLFNYKDDLKNPLDLVSSKVEKYKLYPFYLSPFEDNEIFKSINSELFAHEVIDQDKKELVFTYADAARDVYVVKRFTFSEDSYVIGLTCQVVKDGKTQNVPFVFGPDLENNLSKGRTLQQALKIGAYDGNDIRKVEFRRIKTVPTQNAAIETARSNIDGFYYWAAYETTYFAALFKTDNKDAAIRFSVVKEKISSGKNPQVDLYSYMVVENPTAVYMGPKDEQILASVENIFHNANKAIEYGWFGSIAKLMQKGVNLAHQIVPNYGWAIILFTFFLKLILFPLTYTSSVSMAKMQALQPKIKAIKKKYKNLRDPEQRRQMNMETMELYKKEKVNPAGGCLPLLLQLPILWGLFRFLAVSINVRHEPWILWIKDLSLKDPIFLIPILMGITQLILQKMSPSSADSTQNKMMYIMPIVITFFVMSLPSGLTLYWFVSNLLQIAQQHFINKKIFQQRKDQERTLKQQKRKKGAMVK